MDMLKKIFILFLLSHTFEAYINIENITNVECDRRGLTTFEIEATSEEPLILWNKVLYTEILRYRVSVYINLQLIKE